MLLIPRPGVVDPRGAFTYRQKRGGKVVASGQARNMVVTEGMTDFLNTVFNNQQSVLGGGGLWWIGLVDGGSFSAFDVSDTLASHAGWTEFTDYSASLPEIGFFAPMTYRGYWYRGAPSAGQIIGSDIPEDGLWAAFSNSSTASVQGLFMASAGHKSDNTGILWATCPFESPLTVNTDDTLDLTYSITL